VRGYPQAYEKLDQCYERYLPERGRILDLACGTGANLGRLIAGQLSFSTYLGVDQSASMLAQAQAKFQHLPSTQFIQLDLERDELPGGPFDLVISTWVFEHLAKPDQVAMRAINRLAPGGHLILMFEVSAHRWRERLLDPIWRAGGVHLKPLDAFGSFPDIVSLDQFSGIGPTLALIVCSTQVDLV
jgi:SAM-dependent methyltransferase